MEPEPNPPQEKLLVDGKEHVVDLRPLSLIFHKDDMNIQVPGRVEINPETTVKTAMSFTVGELMTIRSTPQLAQAIESVLNKPSPTSPEELKNASLATKHIVGMFTLMALCTGTNRPIFIRYPETYLHPAQQAEMADVFASWSTKGPPALTFGKNDEIESIDF